MERDEAVQALALSAKENQQLRESVSTMLEQVESARNRQQDAVQRATNAATGEIRSLRENIAKLRSDLDGAEFTKQEAVQSACHPSERNQPFQEDGQRIERRN